MTGKCQGLFHFIKLTETFIYMLPGVAFLLISPIFLLVIFLSFISFKSTLIKCLFFLLLSKHNFFFFFFNRSILFSKTNNLMIFIECMLKVLLKSLSWEWFTLQISFRVYFKINSTSIEFLVINFFLINLTILSNLYIYSEFRILA